MAAVVYFFVVLPYMSARDRFKPDEAESAPTEDITLLTEIRACCGTAPAASEAVRCGGAERRG